MKEDDRTTRLAFNCRSPRESTDHPLVDMAALSMKLGFRIQIASKHPDGEAWQFMVTGDFDTTALPPYVKVVWPIRLSRPLSVLPEE